MIHDIQVSFGTVLKDNDHQLMMVALEDIVGYIREGTIGIQNQTEILRTVLKYDKERYRYMKSQLPYFCMSIFEPNTRKGSHFQKAVGLILDLDFPDHIPDGIEATLQQDPRICLQYVSPSGVGIKLVFVLEEAIDNDIAYNQFYKTFAHDFGQQYKLMDVIDFRNSDVSRVSFLSYDPHAYFNPDPIHLESQLQTEAGGLESTPNTDGLTPEVYKTILNKLDSRPVRTERPQPMKPAIAHIIAGVTEALYSYGIEIIEHENIQYGAKLRVKSGSTIGEVNIYHGKRGYSVVSSARKGTDYKLNEASAHIIDSVISRSSYL